MSYALHPHEKFTKQFRTVADEQLSLAIDALSAQTKGPLEAVHAARKNFKRLRSFYRLAARDEKSFRTQENARIRDMGKTLSEVRDATALVEVADYFADYARAEETEALARVRAALVERRDALAADRDKLEKAIEAAIETCGDARDALSRVSFEDGRTASAKRLSKSWKKTLEGASHALDACADSVDAHLFHELRKRCQDYRFHLQLLEPLWPSAMRTKRMEAERMVDALGHHNDLAVLSGFIEAPSELELGSEDIVPIHFLIERRQEKLRDSALKIAKLMFRDDPDDESQKIRILWRDASR